MNQMEWERMMAQKLYNPFAVGDGSFERVHRPSAGLMPPMT